jgi:hypothetical protein
MGILFLVAGRLETWSPRETNYQGCDSLSRTRAAAKERFLVFGFWFLVFGFWFLVFGFWFLVFGSGAVCFLTSAWAPAVSRPGSHQPFCHPEAAFLTGRRSYANPLACWRRRRIA